MISSFHIYILYIYWTLDYLTQRWNMGVISSIISALQLLWLIFHSLSLSLSLSLFLSFFLSLSFSFSFTTRFDVITCILSAMHFVMLCKQYYECIYDYTQQSSFIHPSDNLSIRNVKSCLAHYYIVLKKGFLRLTLLLVASYFENTLSTHKTLKKHSLYYRFFWLYDTSRRYELY